MHLIAVLRTLYVKRMFMIANDNTNSNQDEDIH
ncbi:hypothetical protein GGQ84_002924 [Desulfitispora alkaliphila]